ncbi:MAG: transcription antitermination factor NusB [Planctomycetota bacterium]
MSRETAFDILRSGSPTPMREVNRFAERDGLDDRDRGLVRAIVGTEVRRRATLRAIVKLFARGNPSPEIATLLRMGIAQLLFLDTVPDHAAISETVDIATRRISLPRGRYVNGVLRTVQRARERGHCGDAQRDIVHANWHFTSDVFRDPQEHPLLWAEDALSMPSNLLKRWQKRFGTDKAFELARTALREPDLSVVAFHADPSEWTALLPEGEWRAGHHERAAILPGHHASALFASEAFQDGRLSIQGETALRAALAVQAQPGMRVLDLCAAPGGKTAWLAKAGATVVATDISAGRLETLHGTVSRLGVADRVETIVSDGTQGLSGDMEMFDAALIDAPCSNTGVLASRPGARWRFGPQSQKDLCTLQARLLDEAAQWIKPGGHLVYSTCSIESDENEQQVRHFLESHPAWSLEHQESHLPAPQGSNGPIDGGYHARLRLE